MSPAAERVARWRPWRRRSRWEELFLEQWDRLEGVAERVARRAGLPPQEVEDFVAGVRLKLIDDDYAVLRKHRGQSSLSTYLITVVHNSFKDECNRKLGKYRPSARAKKLGPHALALERLLVVDRLELDAAVRTLLDRGDVDASEEELRRLADELPAPKAKRSFVDEEVLHRLPANDARAPDEQVQDADRERLADRLADALAGALGDLPAQDALILKMHLCDGFTLAAVAKHLRLPQRPLYTRRQKSLDALRGRLESEGLGWNEVRDLLDWDRDLPAIFAESTSGREANP